MTAPAEALFTDSSLMEAVGRFDDGKVGFPVTDGGGILQGYCGREELYEVLRKFSPPDIRVREFMREMAPVVTENQPLKEGILSASCRRH